VAIDFRVSHPGVLRQAADRESDQLTTGAAITSGVVDEGAELASVSATNAQCDGV
jgi:hypothetical protein